MCVCVHVRAHAHVCILMGVSTNACILQCKRGGHKTASDINFPLPCLKQEIIYFEALWSRLLGLWASRKSPVPASRLAVRVRGCRHTYTPLSLVPVGSGILSSGPPHWHCGCCLYRASSLAAFHKFEDYLNFVSREAPVHFTCSPANFIMCLPVSDFWSSLYILQIGQVSS